jgi:hydrogenase expression/formation protein HypC
MCLGIPGELTEVYARDGIQLGRVRFGAVTREVCLDFEGSAAPGDWVLVHVGFAIAKIDAKEAERAYRVLVDLGDTEELT